MVALLSACIETRVSRPSQTSSQGFDSDHHLQATHHDYGKRLLRNAVTGVPCSPRALPDGRQCSSRFPTHNSAKSERRHYHRRGCLAAARECSRYQLPSRARWCSVLMLTGRMWSAQELKVPSEAWPVTSSYARRLIAVAVDSVWRLRGRAGLLCRCRLGRRVVSAGQSRPLYFFVVLFLHYF